MARVYTLKSTAVPSRLGISYDKDLNDEQREVAFAKDGPCLVIAGAGSGKTRALTYRVAYLLDRGVTASRILLLTFTNRAARQMLERVQQLCGPAGTNVLGGTFHHVANTILKEHAQAVGYQPNFTILDREDAKEVLQAAVADAHIDIKARRFPKADVVMDLISKSLNEQLQLSDILAREAPHFLAVQQEILQVARAYVMRKVRQNVMDFDDLLMNFKVLLAEGGAISNAIAQRFEHIMVDEYQDTNKLQGDIVDLLAAGHHNVMAVGDDAQSIYSFRGARFENIMEFPVRHPGTSLKRLEVNYRSTPQILTLANASIQNNSQRFPKMLRAVRPHGPLPALVPTRDVFEQARFVAQRILELRDEGVSLKEMAVLYRAHNHALELQVELTRRGIPYVVRSGLRFFEQAHIKDVLSFLRFVHNPREELSVRRILKLQEGVGNVVAQTVWECMEDAWSRGKEVRSGSFFTGLDGQGLGRAKTGLAKLGGLVDEMMRPTNKDAPQELIRLVLDGGYRDFLRKSFPNAREREIDLEQLSDYCASFSSIEEMLTEISLMESISSETVVSVEAPDEKLTLSSIHQAKGLEWARVFCIWMADGKLPSDMALRSKEGEEEERRVFYVAATRAKDELYLVHPTSHTNRDRSMIILRPSRFITELVPPSAMQTSECEYWERWELEQAPPIILSAAPTPLVLGRTGEEV